MTQNKAGHLSKAHLYIPPHENNVGRQEIFKKIIKERKDESQSEDLIVDSERLYDDTEDDLFEKKTSDKK
jgi:hypothetical protein